MLNEYDDYNDGDDGYKEVCSCKNKSSDLCDEISISVDRDDNNDTEKKVSLTEVKKFHQRHVKFLKSAVDECFYFTIWTGS